MKGIYKVLLAGDLEGCHALLKGTTSKAARMLREKLLNIEKMRPYMSEKEEDELLFVLQSTFKNIMLLEARKGSDKEEEDTEVECIFDDLKLAMGSVSKSERKKEEKTEKKILAKKAEWELRSRKAESLLYKPQSSFIPIPINVKVGASRADVCILGNYFKVKEALQGTSFENKIDKITHEQAIIRGAILAGFRDDCIWIEGTEPLSRRTYGKDKVQKHPHSVFAKMISRLLPGYTAVSNIIRYKTHYYFLILPSKVVKQPANRLINKHNTELITGWDILH